jgi:hypothetical protein
MEKVERRFREVESGLEELRVIDPSIQRRRKGTLSVPPPKADTESFRYRLRGSVPQFLSSTKTPSSKTLPTKIFP